ncbi:acyl-CoA thiolase [Pseudomonas sp. Boi14]|nr:acyl-CoA thiolase [Pseudomonas sp. Boi14]
MREVVIVDSVRTGLAKSFRGKFNQTRPDDMAAHCVNALLARNGIDPASVEDCIVGAGSNEGAQGFNIGRNVAVLSALGTGTAGMTLNRFCSSGLQAIAIAANQIASGCSDIIVAGGVESISLTMKSVNTENLVNPLLKEQVPGIYFPMGQTAEVVARRYGVSREAQDRYSLQSQQRTAQAQAAGLFSDEIVPMTVKYKVEDKNTGEVQILDGVVDRDDCNRPDTTLENLAALKPVFADDGSVTAGNSSQLSDGASMTLVMSLERALALGLKPKAFFRGFTVAGCEPDEMGIGPVFSVPKLLKAKGLSVADIDLWELNEAFASQCRYARDRLEIDNARYNVNGGSISIGHPFGMTGSRQVGHLVRELQRRNLRYGIVTMCVGGGMGPRGCSRRYARFRFVGKPAPVGPVCDLHNPVCALSPTVSVSAAGAGLVCEPCS